MAIRVQLDRILLDRRMSLTELADRVGVTLANLSILKTGKARAMRFTTLDALCRELDCQPGDLLIYEAGPQDPGAAGDRGGNDRGPAPPAAAAGPRTTAASGLGSPGPWSPAPVAGRRSLSPPRPRRLPPRRSPRPNSSSRPGRPPA